MQAIITFITLIQQHSTALHSYNSSDKVALTNPASLTNKGNPNNKAKK